MPREEFEQMIAESYEQLPEWVRRKITNVAVLVEDEPSDEIRKQEDLSDDETLLGHYQGIPLSSRGENYGVGGTLPDAITLYQIPIEDEARENVRVYETLNFGEAIKRVVADTIWHEFAHHFGIEEDEVQRREAKRKL